MHEATRGDDRAQSRWIRGLFWDEVLFEVVQEIGSSVVGRHLDGDVAASY